MRKKKQRILGILLCLLLVVGLMPGTSMSVRATSPAYLTFTGTGEFSIKTDNNSKNWNGNLEYSTNASTWTEWDGKTIYSANNVLYIRGTGNTVIAGGYNRYWEIITDGTVACSGDIRTLLDYANPENANMGDKCFQYMFDSCTKLTAAPELPATNLAPYCYASMFYGCTSLTAVPALPATTMAQSCYASMFWGCTSLTAVPTLPATTLASFCYYRMFKGCTSLTAAPELPATTLAMECYEEMFQNCSSIKLSETQTEEYNTAYRIPKEGTGTPADSALNNMFTETGGTFKGTPTINTTYYMIGPPHIHDFAYSVSTGDNASTITAECGGVGICDITDGLTITISAPAGELTYDGSTSFPATLSTVYNTTAFLGTYTIVYTKDGAAFDGTLTEAGEYVASVTVGEGDGEATASVSYTVNKADSTAAAVTANNRTYDGTEKPLVTVTGKATGGEMQYALGTDAITAPTDGWSASIPKGTNAGTYYVWYKAVGDATHSDTEAACVTVIITDVPKTNSVYRIYNPNSGEHFFTTSATEKNNLVKVGWRYEGVAWSAPKSGTPVLRLYNPNAGDHHYTTSTAEKNNLVKVGWRYEGVAFYSGGSKPIYRAYNPNAVSGAHHFTISLKEKNNIVKAGWRYEGVGFYTN